MTVAGRAIGREPFPTPRVGVLLLWLALGPMLAGCGLRSSDPPAPGDARGAVPDLHGQDVMVLPVQRAAGISRRGGGPSPDDEIAYALEDAAPNVEWAFPRELREMLEMSPGFEVRIDGLDVGVFLQAEVERVGDPLFGQLRRLSALAGADLALIPVRVLHRGETDNAPAAVEVTATLLDARSGRVFWFGMVEGAPGPPGDPAAMASAAEALTRAMGF